MAGGSNWWSHPGLRLATLRQWHSYLGVFIAPSVLFFALTGALQLFSLHEAHGDYHPPALIEALGKVHKDQVFEAGKKHAPKAAPKAEPKAAAAEPDADHDDDHHEAAPPRAGAQHAEADHDADHDHDHAKKAPKLGTYLLKWCFLVVAIGLASSTLIGLWMALAHGRRKGVLWTLFVIGAVLPVALLLV
jgi:hypothetical protein